MGKPAQAQQLSRSGNRARSRNGHPRRGEQATDHDRDGRAATTKRLTTHGTPPPHTADRPAATASSDPGLTSNFTITGWDRAHLHSVALADDTLLTGPCRWDDSPEVAQSSSRVRLSRLAEQFLCTFDLGDDWTQLCHRQVPPYRPPLR